MAQPRCRVLCIDDHEDTSEMLGLILADEDHDVVTATSVKAALELVQKQTFDLYVLDRRLPDGSGLDLCQQLGELTPGVPCIFYSGDAYAIHKSEAIAAGADDYVVKPDLDRLIESVQKLLAEKHCAAAAK